MLNTEPLIENEKSLIELISWRASMYGLLSRIFEKEADGDLLDQMSQMKMPRSSGDEKADAAFRMLCDFLSSRWERTEEDLRIDYARTFFGSNTDGHGAAYPFESVHTSADRLMMQDARDEVLALYRSEGLEKAETWKDNEDHIALELAFEKALCDKALTALESGDHETALRKLIVQYNFLQTHLLNWTPMFVHGIERFSRTDFYKATALLMSCFLEEDEAFLEEVMRDCNVATSFSSEEENLLEITFDDEDDDEDE